MIKRNQQFLNRVNQFLDFVLVIGAYVFSRWLRLYVLDGSRDNMAMSRGMLTASVVYALALSFGLMLAGFYNTQRIQKLGRRLTMLFAATTATILAASTLLYAFRLEDFSRGVLVLFYLATLGVLGGKCVAMRFFVDRLRAQGYNIKHEALIGNGPLSQRYLEDVAAQPELGIYVDAVLATDDSGEIQKTLSRQDIDEVVIALEAEEYQKIRFLIGLCEKHGVKYMVIPFYNDIMPAHPVMEKVGRSRLIDMRTNRLENLGWAIVKRSFDIVVSAAGLILLSPLLLLIALGVKLSSPGPVLFRQTRVGYRRRSFQMLKFRSMRVNDRSNTTWSSDVDDRRTAFGAFIRKTSLDELPQLWNVLKGEMSLVGPRPELPYFVEQFREAVPLYMVKHQVKPGITGWAQVNGYRGDTSIERRIEYDLWYIDNWSIWLDLKILFRTVPGAMINGERTSMRNHLNIKVIVATHKPYWMPDDPLYLPLQVGAEGKEGFGFARDDTGDNISEKNANYCELTGLYWAWKNLNCEALGLAHYRRHFTAKRWTKNRSNVLTMPQAENLLASVDVLLPKKRHYWIETNYSQYAHAHHAFDLDTTREIIRERFPDYLPAYDIVMKRTSGHRFNMFIMKREIADAYCDWLFGILFELEKRLDLSVYSTNDQRVFGFVAERLLDVWLLKNRINYREVPYIFLEKQDWIAKGTAFVIRKVKGGKEQ